MTLPSKAPQPFLNRPIENALMSSVLDSPSAITSEIAFPTGGACCIPCSENPFASTNLGQFRHRTGDRVVVG